MRFEVEDEVRLLLEHLGLNRCKQQGSMGPRVEVFHRMNAMCPVHIQMAF
jgi:hypothetical protein